jgi:hypothetical protein
VLVLGSRYAEHMKTPVVAMATQLAVRDDAKLEDFCQILVRSENRLSFYLAI